MEQIYLEIYQQVRLPILTHNLNGADRTVDLSGNLTVESTSVIDSDLSSDANWSTSGSITGGNLNLTASNPTILGADTDGVLTISANAATLGANIELYGDTHATLAGDIAFRNNVADELYFDASSNLWNFGANAISNAGVVQGVSFVTNSNIGVAADTDLLQLAANALTVNGNQTWSNSSTTITYGDAGALDDIVFKGRGTFGSSVQFTRDDAANSIIMAILAGSATCTIVEQFTLSSTNEGIDITAATAGKDITLTSPEIILAASTGVGIGTTAPSEKLDVDGRMELTQQSGSTNDGALWNDSTQKALQTYVSGIEQTLTGCIFTQTADQTIANTTTETTLFGTGVGTLTLPANFWVVGKTIRLEIHGDFADTGNPTAEVQVYYGATSLIDSGAIALSGLAGTEQWETEVIITCRSVGATGTLETVIDWEYETSVGSSPIERLDVAGTTTVVDTTASGALDVTFQWGTAAAANTLTSEIGFVQILN